MKWNNWLFESSVHFVCGWSTIKAKIQECYWLMMTQASLGYTNQKYRLDSFCNWEPVLTGMHNALWTAVRDFTCCVVQFRYRGMGRVPVLVILVKLLCFSFLFVSIPNLESSSYATLFKAIIRLHARPKVSLEYWYNNKLASLYQFEWFNYASCHNSQLLYVFPCDGAPNSECLYLSSHLQNW